MDGVKVFKSTSVYSGSPGYPERSGELVEVLRPLTAEEVDVDTGPMFRIRFRDGVETVVFADELKEVS